MKFIKLYEDFDWNDDDFDEEEFDVNIPKIGDWIEFDELIMWNHDKGEWIELRNSFGKVKVFDVKLVDNIDYLKSPTGRKIPIDNNLPTDYNGYMVLTRYWPWFKLDKWKLKRYTNSHNFYHNIC